jgi:dTDP-4-amino-4,6-dideoxygalactose transaminase
MRMDEIRAALAKSMLKRLPGRLTAHHLNYHHVSGQLAEEVDAGQIALRKPVARDAFLGEALVFRLPGAPIETSAWFAAALRAEGISARAFADPADPNVRAFWNWRFMFPDCHTAMASYPQTTRYLAQAVDVPLSANLTEADGDQLVSAIRKVLAALPERAR